MFTSEFAIRFMVSAVSAKALLKFWIAVSVSAFMCSPPSRAPAQHALLNHLIRPDQHRLRDGKAERPSAFAVLRLMARLEPTSAPPSWRQITRLALTTL